MAIFDPSDYVVSNTRALRILWAGSGSALIANTDISNSVWIGGHDGIRVGSKGTTTLPPGGSVTVDGTYDIWAISNASSCIVTVIPGGTSYNPNINYLSSLPFQQGFILPSASTINQTSTIFNVGAYSNIYFSLLGGGSNNAFFEFQWFGDALGANLIASHTYTIIPGGITYDRIDIQSSYMRFIWGPITASQSVSIGYSILPRGNFSKNTFAGDNLVIWSFSGTVAASSSSSLGPSTTRPGAANLSLYPLNNLGARVEISMLNPNVGSQTLATITAQSGSGAVNQIIYLPTYALTATVFNLNTAAQTIRSTLTSLA